MDEQAKMAAMEAWLDQVCAALDVDRAQLAAVTPQILDLVAKCAHGPSRPGGPLTAMAVGIAATRTDDFVAGVNAGIAAIEPLLDESDR